MSDIRFVFEGKRYTAPAAFYDTGLARIVAGFGEEWPVLQRSWQ